MIRTDLQCYLAIISARRPQNVVGMQDILGDATWYVAEGESAEYRQAGAQRAIESGALCASRNAALRDAWEQRLPCVQLSDDLCKLAVMRYSNEKQRYVAVPNSFTHVVTKLLRELRNCDAKLGGVAPTNNPLNYNPRRPVAMGHFIVGDFIAVQPCSLFFDERFLLKEDYDYTMQHLARYGIVARCDSILADFKHRTNPGGAVSVRTTQLEDENIALLKYKWKGHIIDNPRRPHEVLLKWQRPEISRREVKS